MNSWFVTYIVQPRCERPNERQYYKQAFDNYEDAMNFYNKRKIAYPALPVWLPDKIGFHKGGRSEAFSELLSSVKLVVE